MTDGRHARRCAPPTALALEAELAPPHRRRRTRRGRAVPSAPAVRRHDAQHRDLGAVRRAPARRLSRACASTSAASRAARASYDDGRDEPLDVVAAIDAIAARGARRRRSSLVGWSFGADMALVGRRPARRGLGRRSRRRCGSGRRSPRVADDPRPKHLVLARARRVPRARARCSDEVATWTERRRPRSSRAPVTSSWAAPTASSTRRGRHSTATFAALSGELLDQRAVRPRSRSRSRNVSRRVDRRPPRCEVESRSARGRRPRTRARARRTRDLRRRGARGTGGRNGRRLRDNVTVAPCAR